jgi:hypothetical protein
MQRYIGKPYNFRNYNCWQHAAKVRDDFGIKTRMFQPRTIKEAFVLIQAQMTVIDNGLSLVDEPQDFDIVFIEKEVGGRRVYHCGVFHDGNVSHCCNNFGSVRYEPLNDFKKGYTGVSFWR